MQSLQIRLDFMLYKRDDAARLLDRKLEAGMVDWVVYSAIQTLLTRVSLSFSVDVKVTIAIRPIILTLHEIISVRHEFLIPKCCSVRHLTSSRDIFNAPLQLLDEQRPATAPTSRNPTLFALTRGCVQGATSTSLILQPSNRHISEGQNGPR